MLELILLYFIIFAYLAIHRLDWALMIILFALWSYLIRFSVFGIPTTLLEGMVIISFVVWLMKNWSNIWFNVKNKVIGKKINNRYPFDWEIFLLLIISLIAVGTAHWSWSAWGIWRAYFFEPILFFIVFFNVLGKENYTKTIAPLCASTFILSLIAIWQKLTGIFVVPDFWNNLGQRATSVFPYPNALGLYLAPLVMILIGWLGYQLRYKDESNKWRIARIVLSIITVLMSVAAIVSAQSEGALVALLAGLVVFGLLANRKTAIVTVIILAMVSTGILLNQPVYEKVKDKVTLFDLSGQIRQQQWKETWEMLKDGRLISGSGLSNYQQIITPYHQEGIFVKNHDPNWLDKVLNDPVYHKQAWQPTEIYMYPHNIVLNFWSELGLLGVLLFIWIIVKYFIIALKNIFGYNSQYHNKYLALGLLGAMVTVVVHGMVDVPYFKNDLAIIFWLLLAMLGIIHLRNKQKVV